MWTVLEIREIEPSNKAGGRALRQSVIQRKINRLPCNSLGFQSRQGGICSRQLLTVTTTVRQKRRNV